MNAATFLLKPESFRHVEHMTGARYENSPQIPDDDDWTGVCINAPETIVLTARSRDLEKALVSPIPMCASYLLGVPDLNLLCVAKASLRDIHTQRIYSGEVSCREGDRFFYPQTLPDDAGKDSARGGYAAWDLSRYIAIPAKAATYELTLTVGKTQSNTVKLSVIIEEERDQEKTDEV